MTTKLTCRECGKPAQAFIRTLPYCAPHALEKAKLDARCDA